MHELKDLEQFFADKLGKSQEFASQDPKLWCGILIASCGISMLIWLVSRGQAVRPKDGYNYTSEEFLTYVSFGFALWRWGINFVYLNAWQYYLSSDVAFYCVLFGPVLLISIEKTVFMLSMASNRWIERFYFPDDVEGVSETSISFEASSIYERFEWTNRFKVTLVIFLQSVLIVFYTKGLQFALYGDEDEAAPYPYLFWMASFAVQEVANLTDVFGKDFNFFYWCLMVTKAGNLSHLREATGEITTPSALGIYVHFFFAWSFEVFGRNLLLMSLPLFLMSSETPIDFMLNCVATGFFTLISQIASGTYKFILEEDDEEDEGDEIEEELMMPRAIEAGAEGRRPQARNVY